MKFLYLFLFFSFANSEKFIKNIIMNPCKNCVYFKQHSILPFSQCEKFGEKNIISNEIIYDYADTSRKHESKCGIEGKYFEKDKDLNLKLKKIKFEILDNSYQILVVFLISFLSISYMAKMAEN